VSYFTRTLDLIEQLLEARSTKFLRLDGQVDAMKRQKLVDRFNQRGGDIKVFLLCAKAGGTGLNLTGANKMILMEADWNPSNDNQVMGRIWRDGQKKEVDIYRLVSCGTLEEKIIQRQFLKEDLSKNVVDERTVESTFDSAELKKIFKFANDEESISFNAEDNEKDMVFGSNADFQGNMDKYVVYVKKKIDLSKEREDTEDAETPIKNEFLEDNIFMTEPTEEEKKD